MNMSFWRSAVAREHETKNTRDMRLTEQLGRKLRCCTPAGLLDVLLARLQIGDDFQNGIIRDMRINRSAIVRATLFYDGRASAETDARHKRVVTLLIS